MNNRVNNKVTLISLTSCILSVDNNKKILNLEVINDKYIKQESLNLLEYIKTFWVVAKENNDCYHFIINIHALGIYPLSLFQIIKDCLIEIEYIFKEHLHSSCIIVDSPTIVSILKPLFNIYKTSRPFTFVKNYEDGLMFINKNKIK